MKSKIKKFIFKLLSLMFVTTAIVSPAVVQSTKKADAFAFTPSLIGAVFANGTYKRDFIGEKIEPNTNVAYYSHGYSSYRVAKSVLWLWQDRVYWDGRSKSYSSEVSDQITQEIRLYVSGAGVPGFSLSTDSASVGINFETLTNGVKNTSTNVRALYTDYTIDNWIWELTSFEYDVVSSFRRKFQDEIDVSISVSAVHNNINENWNATHG